ncbi:glycosyltransferase family 4 protein [Desulfosporosinus hippei]|uniref:Glycosyltransferase involved in cell wall bisynthesis n=1 Tax=Desulfosporosinus hippei DSM 8344 TaxID=1121419 RepID=A0A1G8IZZ0_9FIRM|nr:glycosyltransferase [Desulfosporosinus hippei]SDI24471.1 Glycosyltransferase involved in cell wall bisynthesis [Desulfosporosinus hippei DSM 8344]
MKILFQARPDFMKNPAGDTVQIVSTGQALKALGIEAHFSSDPNIDVSSYDLVHIFNITRIKESYMFFLNAQKQGKKIIISPIYWPPNAYLNREGASSNALAAWKHTQPMRARLLRECDLLLPNSQIEMDVLQQDFLKIADYHVTPNGFPDSFIGTTPKLFREQFPNIPDEFVLCAARISPRKNQLWLAKTCHELGLSLVLLGPVNDQNYYKCVLSFSNVTHIGTLQGQLLASAYAASKAHALPSWFETPGLSSLEASACGTVVISTDQGSPKEYFQDMALYVHPLDNTSLHTALEQSYNASPLPLMQHIHKHYPWSRVAEITLEAYNKVLS